MTEFKLPGEGSRVGLILPASLSKGEWLEVGKVLRRVESGLMWWLGDWLIFGQQRKWGEKYDEAVKLGIDYGVARNAAYVADKFQLSRRRDNLTWSHHAEVAGLDPADADRLLDEAERERWSRNVIREQVRIANLPSINAEDGCTVADLNALVRAGKQFPTILADPPWEFKVYSGKGKQRSADRFYVVDQETGSATQSIEQLKQMPIANLAADDCALFLWCVMPELPGAIEVMRAWGFEYKTAAFCWVKATETSQLINLAGDGLHWGMGYWTRANTEICLLGTKGSPKRLARDVHQVIVSPVGEHSRKPEETHARIERLVTGPYLELYGRRPMKGWTVWGNDIARGLFHQSIPEFGGQEHEQISVGS